MEETAELNEMIENTEPGDGTLMRSSALLISPETNWHQNVSFSRSPKLVMGTLKGKDQVRQTNFHPGSDSPHGMQTADERVEELTVNNYKQPTLSLPGSSNSGDEMPVKKCLWENFYKLVGESRDVTVLENGADIGNISLSHPGTSRFSLQKYTDKSHANVVDHFPEKDNHVIMQNTSNVSPRGIQTKVLPAAGFPQFLIKSSLKGKGISHRHPGSHGALGVAVQSHNVERAPDTSKKWPPNILHKAGRTKFLRGSVGGTAIPDHLHGISLRCWLKPGEDKVQKAERFHIFKQVLELVDGSHSKGIALQNLRPSNFIIFSSSHVKYVGLFVAQTQMGSFEVVRTQATDGTYLRRKRSQCNGNSDLLPAKFPRLNGDIQVGGRTNVFGIQNGLNGVLAKEFDSDNLIVGNHESDYREQLICGGFNQSICGSGLSTLSSNGNFEIMPSEERWYASPEELNGSTCWFTSNIYSLGVLFFELFCCFESLEVHAAAMLDLRHRILPSSFLSGKPKEAGFCLWLLHPEPSSRPKSREVLQCDLICEIQDTILFDQPSASFDEEDAKAELLLHFLSTLKEQKERQAEKLVENVGCLSSDIEEIEKRHLSRIEHLSTGMATGFNEASDRILYGEPLCVGKISRSSVSSMNEERLMRNINQLDNVYFSMRCNVNLPDSSTAERSDNDVLRNRERCPVIQNSDVKNCIEKDPDRLGSFFDGLCKYARYNKFEVRGILRNGDILNSANVICSLSFDRDEEYFAAAGVAKKVKIFEYASLLSDNVDIHYPVVEMPSKSRLSCVCWNGYIKNYLASTDYEGTVQLWDASTGQGFMQYAEHQRRAWSVDFSRVDPTRFVSGSDDYCVKLWSINEKNSTNTIRNVANVCCVQFSAYSSNLLAFGSADYKIYCYDLRHTRVPWCTLIGHGKAVSYVKFVDSETLVSASTDSTLKLWDLNKTDSSGLSSGACSVTFRGHANEKNFVGLSVSNGYITCGSETNDVYAYYKSLPMPITSHKFGSIDPISGQESGDDNGQFVSSVCWREKSDVVVAANSSGCIKLLQMV